MQSLGPRAKTLLFWTGFLLPAGFFLSFAAAQYPVMYSDAVGYLPGVVEWTAGRGFINPVTHDGFLTDPTGQNRFISYPPYFQYLLAWFLLWTPGVNGLYWGLHVLNAVTVAAWMLVACLYFGKPSGWSVRLGLGVVSGLLGLASYLLGHFGRPETPVILCLALGLAAERTFKGIPKDLAQMILLGLGASAHPIGALLWALGLGCREAILRPAREAFARFARISAGGALLMSGILTLSPYGFWETILGTWRHARFAVLMPHESDFFFYAVLDPKAMFFGPAFFTAAAWMVRDLTRRKEGVRSPLMLAALGAVGFFVLWRTVLASPLRIYNVYLFAPFFFGVLLRLIHEARAGKAVSWILVLMLAATSAGFLRTAALFPYYLADGVRLTQARELFRRVREDAKRDGKYIIHDSPTSAWVLSDDYEDIRCIVDETMDLGRVRGGFFILGESYRGGRRAPDYHYGSLKLTEDHFVAREARLGPIRLASSIPGHGFAVYRMPEDYAY